jgi:hypothetical protein
MGWIVRDYLCDCGNAWEDLVDTTCQEQHCPKCDRANKHIISACNIATYSLMSKDDQAKHLRKRSRDHTRKMLKKDPTSMKQSRHVLKKK